MTELQVYLWLKLDTLNILFNMLGAVSLCMFVVFIIANIFEEQKKTKECIIIAVLCLFFGIIGIIMPTTKQYAVIKVLPKIVNNEIVKDMPNNLVDKAKEYLKDMFKRTERN